MVMLTDILCRYSCLHIILFRRGYKKIYYILKGEGWLDRLAAFLLHYFGWKIIPVEYEFEASGLNAPFIDLQKDLITLSEEHIKPVIESQIYRLKYFSEYEKRRIAAYIAWLEKRNLYQRVEILHILKLLKDQIDKPDIILLRSSIWDSILSAKYEEGGHKTDFYKIYSPFKIEKREKYFNDLFVREAVERKTFLKLCWVIYKIALTIFHSIYFAVIRLASSDIPQKIGRFDICAILSEDYQKKKSFIDLFWRREHGAKRYRTLAIAYRKFDKSAYAHYRHLAERWVSLSGLSSPPHIYSIFYWMWPIYPKILVHNMLKLLPDLLSSDMDLSYKIRMMQLFMAVSEMEALFKITGIKVVWSSAEGNPLESLAGTIAINRVKGVSLGSTWSAYNYPLPPIQRDTNDVLFVWGTRHAQMFFQGGAVVKSMVISGYIGDYYLRHFVSEANILRDRWKKQYRPKAILCLYDNIFFNDDEINFSFVVNCIERLLLWTMKESETLLVIKTKRKEIFNEYPASIKELLRNLSDQKRLVYEFKRADLTPGFASDIVLGFCLATLPCLLGTYGKDTVLLDSNRYGENWSIGTSNITFITRPEDITKILNDRISRLYEKGISEGRIEVKPIPNSLDSFVDGRSAERIGAYISNLIEDLNKGSSSDEAIDNVNRRYREIWGADKVIMK